MSLKKFLKSPTLMRSVSKLCLGLSVTGVATMAPLSAKMEFWILATLTICFALLGFLGTFIKEDIEDGKTFMQEIEDELAPKPETKDEP